MALSDHPELDALVRQRREHLAARAGSAALVADAALTRLLLASDFAYEELLGLPDPVRWAQWPEPEPRPPVLRDLPEAQWPGSLRRFRRRAGLRLVWRDVCGLDAIEDTLAGSSRLAEACLNTALDALHAQMAARHGPVRDAAGRAQALVVFGLGKLGGGELNFSSDVDLVFAYPEAGVSDGPRPLDAEAWFVRLGQRLIQLLDEATADGFCHRVDMRLRPFGDSGRLALSFAAMEDYFQREGRDWERYAWIKARPVAGDLAAGERLLETLRPFVYRRYLDYTALDSLREMKALIAAEVARRDLAEHIKLGPGGIREIEFLVQSLQLIRGGREPALRQRALLPALHALEEAGHLSAAVVQALAAAYGFERRLENRLQMLADRQVHRLPEDAPTRARIALGLGYPDWPSLYADLARHRHCVSEEFDRLLAPRRPVAAASVLSLYWTALPAGGSAQALAEAGFADPESADARLREFARAPALHELAARGRARLDRLLPGLLQTALDAGCADAALPRLLAVLQTLVRRGSYLALLEEQPALLRRLVEVLSRSALLTEALSRQPLLLDELLQGPSPDEAPTRQSLAAELDRLLRPLPAGQIEEALRLLNEFRHGAAFRIALRRLEAGQSAAASARQLAWLAEAVVAAALRLAAGEIAAQHGPPPGGGLAAIGYGSLGGEELGFASDLDLVFLYAVNPNAISAGPRPLEAARWYARLVQKLVGLLALPTPSGRLYQTDLRLRPDGAGGLLVSTVDSFGGYQRERAWTWERQALVRARPVAGAPAVCAAFERVRAEAVGAAGALSDPGQLRDEIRHMRARMRAELDRSGGGWFDLKHGLGGLVDLEFLLQYHVLAAAPRQPALLGPRASAGLIAALAGAGHLGEEEAERLAHAHETLLAAALACTLDGKPRRVQPDADLEQARAAIIETCRAHGLDFGSKPE